MRLTWQTNSADYNNAGCLFSMLPVVTDGLINYANYFVLDYFAFIQRKVAPKYIKINIKIDVGISDQVKSPKRIDARSQ